MLPLMLRSDQTTIITICKSCLHPYHKVLTEDVHFWILFQFAMYKGLLSPFVACSIASTEVYQLVLECKQKLQIKLLPSGVFLAN